MFVFKRKFVLFEEIFYLHLNAKIIKRNCVMLEFNGEFNRMIGYLMSLFK